MNRITLDDTAVSGVVKMSDGNPGAATALGEMLKTPLGMIDMCHLDDAEIYGSDIWVGYKDICDFDIDKFVKMVRNRTLKAAITQATDSSNLTDVSANTKLLRKQAPNREGRNTVN